MCFCKYLLPWLCVCFVSVYLFVGLNVVYVFFGGFVMSVVFLRYVFVFLYVCVCIMYMFDYYRKWNFPMSPNVRLSVGRSIGLSVGQVLPSMLLSRITCLSLYIWIFFICVSQTRIHDKHLNRDVFNKQIELKPSQLRFIFAYVNIYSLFYIPCTIGSFKLQQLIGQNYSINTL